MEFKEPIVVTWFDIFQTFQEGEEREYDTSKEVAIRHAISRRVKYERPDLSFTTWTSTAKTGDRKFHVRRLTQEEITQQQQSAVSAG
ncbi:hypothetical protein [Parapedobacter indicus]|uniref:Uncharacterized protein n=1 Tax=Parapedobacter indicus TaxID=1477437 RepID=A0A1I3DZT1_9SPHI|nr:hypothetical protein [Parapedobacter indicus]PPL04911.1 hypothetical protein CLV26_101721 [Parapedobacter indicus]SFH92254.1 hypothetical protein SAMN05444682_101707 [Parapedobacter indicus]